MVATRCPGVPVLTGSSYRLGEEALVDEQLVLVTPPEHRLAPTPRLALADLRDEPFVCLPPDSGLRTIVKEAADAEGFEPSVPFETHGPNSIRELVSASLGVALLARSAASSPGPPVTIHTVDPTPAHPPIGLIHHRDRRLSPAAQTCRRPPGPGRSQGSSRLTNLLRRRWWRSARARERPPTGCATGGAAGGSGVR